jgi:branched-chain amino acid aminotransferase
MNNLVWLNDSLVNSEDAQVSVFDHGFTVGDGVFETLQVKAGEAFALSRHLKRLNNSASLLGVSIPDTKFLKSAISEVLKANNELAQTGRLRITVTSGDGPLGSDRNSDNPTLVVAISKLPNWASSAKIATVKMPRNHLSPLAGAKTTSYAENVLALSQAKAQGADEALLPNVAGNICEGTGSNFFAVIDNQVFTPPLTAGCLGGITRELVCEWFDCIEQDLPFEALTQISAAFLTSTTRDVQPISQIDQNQLEVDHKLVKQIQSEFLINMKKNIDP